jgi:signal transduction histidine kinase
VKIIIDQKDANCESANAMHAGFQYPSDPRMLEEEIRKLSLRLQQAEAGKSQFLSNVRNEINNPMASIMGLAASIIGLSTEEKVRTISSLIQKQASQLDFQMRNIIMAAEIELGTLYPSSSRINVNTLIENQVSYFAHTLIEKNIDVVFQVPDHVRFQTDSQMLQAICLNLIANAIEFSGARKQVVITAEVVNGCLELSVTDFGQGIDQAQQTQLFQRFTQLQSGVCKQHKGHGLGLCIVNELIHRLQGILTIDSENGSGTCVTIKLPELVQSAEGGVCSSNGNESLFTIDEEF